MAHSPVGPTVASGGRNWLGIAYLTNLSLMIFAALVYMGDLPFPILAGSTWQRPASLLIWLAALALLWFLLDSFGIIRQSPFLTELCSGQGLRWLDVTLAAAALAILFLCLRRRQLDEPVAIICGLGLLHGILGFLQYQQPYSDRTIAEVRPDESREYGQQGDEPLATAEDLHRRAPDDAEAARDLVASYYEQARAAKDSGNETEAERCLGLCHGALLDMRARGVHLDEEMQQLLNWLESQRPPEPGPGGAH